MTLRPSILTSVSPYGKFIYILSNTFIYKPILIEIYMNAKLTIL
jgi:hypothetical protein